MTSHLAIAYIDLSQKKKFKISLVIELLRKCVKCDSRQKIPEVGIKCNVHQEPLMLICGNSNIYCVHHKRYQSFLLGVTSEDQRI